MDYSGALRIARRRAAEDLQSGMIERGQDLTAAAEDISRGYEGDVTQDVSARILSGLSAF